MSKPDGVETSMRVAFGGHHTEVVIIDGRVVKLMPGKLAPFTLEEAKNLAVAMDHYGGALREMGISVPAIHDLRVERGEESDRVVIVMECDNAGPDLRDEVSLAHTGVEAARDILKLLHNLLQQTSGALQVGIDPKPANFCRSEDGKIWFVDLMPPRFYDRITGLLWTEYPEPKSAEAERLVHWRYFEQCGVLIVLLIHLCRQCPGLHQQFLDMILAEAKALCIEEEFRYFAALDFMGRPREEQLTLIDQLRKPHDVFRGRTMACGLVARYHPPLATGTLAVIFKETLFRDGFSESQLQRLRQQLTRLVYDSPLLPLG